MWYDKVRSSVNMSFEHSNFELLNHPSLVWRICDKELRSTFCSLMIPNIEDPFEFDLLQCFSLSRSEPRQFTAVGHFLNIADRNTLLGFPTNRLEGSLDFNRLELTKEDDRMTVTIKVTVEGLRKHQVDWDCDGPMMLDIDKVDLRGSSIYVISEIIVAETVHMNVDVVNFGRTSYETEMIPISFSLLKYPVDEDGILLDAEQTKFSLEDNFFWGRS